MRACGSAARRSGRCPRSPPTTRVSCSWPAPTAAGARLDVSDDARSDGRGDLRPARRAAAGHRAGRRPHARVPAAADPVPAERPLPPAHRRLTHGAASPTDPAGRRRLELRPALRRRAAGVRPAVGVPRRLRPGHGPGRVRRRRARCVRCRGHHPGPRRQVARQRRPRRRRRALHAAPDPGPVRPREARRARRSRTGPRRHGRALRPSSAPGPPRPSSATSSGRGSPPSPRSRTTSAPRSSGRSPPTTPRPPSRSPVGRAGRTGWPARRSRPSAGSTRPSRAPARSSDVTHALALTGRGLIDFQLGLGTHVDADFEAALAVFRAHGDPAPLAFTHSFYAEVAAARGDVDEARRRRQELLAFYQSLPDDPFVVAARAYSTAKLGVLDGDLATAERCYRAAADGFARVDRPMMLAMCLGMVADFDERAGDHELRSRRWRRRSTSTTRSACTGSTAPCSRGSAGPCSTSRHAPSAETAYQPRARPRPAARQPTGDLPRPHRPGGRAPPRGPGPGGDRRRASRPSSSTSSGSSPPRQPRRPPSGRAHRGRRVLHGARLHRRRCRPRRTGGPAARARRTTCAPTRGAGAAVPGRDDVARATRCGHVARSVATGSRQRRSSVVRSGRARPRPGRSRPDAPSADSARRSSAAQVQP